MGLDKYLMQIIMRCRETNDTNPSKGLYRPLYELVCSFDNLFAKSNIDQLLLVSHKLWQCLKRHSFLTGIKLSVCWSMDCIADAYFVEQIICSILQAHIMPLIIWIPNSRNLELFSYFLSFCLCRLVLDECTKRKWLSFSFIFAHVFGVKMSLWFWILKLFVDTK